MSPITTTITMPMTTIPRKSFNMVAELALWIPDTTERQEGLLCRSQGCDTKARAAQRTVIQLKSEVAQSQQSRTESRTQMDSLVDCPQATERSRSRQRGGPNTRTIVRIVAGQAQYDPTEPQAAFDWTRIS